MSPVPVPSGQLAAVVTYLEMGERPGDLAVPPSSFQLKPVERPETTAYRALFTLVGTPWLWFSRLILTDEELSRIIADPGVELFEVCNGDEVVGMLELDYRIAGECELAFVGLVPGLSGQGHGRWLLAEAIDRAWRDGINRVHVHTCNLDHPAALSAYRRAGFIAVSRAVEMFIDPRLAGIHPRDAAPQLPLIEPGPADYGKPEGGFSPRG